jgi:hypothetical protein
MKKAFPIIILLLIMFACKKKETLLQTPIDKKAEFELLATNSGFKTLWSYQPLKGLGYNTQTLSIKDLTMNLANDNIDLLLAAYTWSGSGAKRLAVDLTNNSEILIKDYNNPLIRVSDQETIVQYQPYTNRVFYWGVPGYSGEIFDNDVYSSTGTGSTASYNNLRVTLNGSISKHRLLAMPITAISNRNNYAYVNMYGTQYAAFNNVNADQEVFQKAIVESKNDSTHYVIGLMNDPNNLTLKKIKLFKSNEKINTTNSNTTGNTNLLSEINLSTINLVGNVINTKVHYTTDGNSIVIGVAVKESNPNSATNKLYSFIFSKTTEQLTLVLNGISVNSNIFYESDFDLDDFGNFYYIYNNYSDYANQKKNIFKVTTGGVQRIGAELTLASNYYDIDYIKILKNKPYIVVTYIPPTPLPSKPNDHEIEQISIITLQ